MKKNIYFVSVEGVNHNKNPLYVHNLNQNSENPIDPYTYLGPAIDRQKSTKLQNENRS